MNILRILVLVVLILVLAMVVFSGQKIETVDGVRVVHNSGPDAWGKKPAVTLEPVRVLGDVFWTKSGQLIMGTPRLRFRFMDDAAEKKAELPKLVKVIDGDGKILGEFGDPRDFKDEMVNSTANEVILTVDGAGGACLVFPRQNRIDRHAADGRLLWRADRELSYEMDIREKGNIDRSGGNMRVQMPRINQSANGVAVDGIFIYGDRLFLMDKFRDTQFREYKIRG